MAKKKKIPSVREIIAHLQTLPQDMEVRMQVIQGNKASYHNLEFIEIHQLGEAVPNKHWTNKAVIFTIKKN
jgi:hypothetical protein